MTKDSPAHRRPELSVVMPAFNSAPWLPSTFRALSDAVRRADVTVEAIVVDDGSTDATATTVEAIRPSFPGRLSLLRQDNQGRYRARLNGLTRADSETVLLLDSRVLIAPEALAYVIGELRKSGAPRVWNAGIRTDPAAPLVGLFWDVPTYVFWGGYLRAPRPYDLDAENFDSAPKGTGVFLAPREMLLRAFEHARPVADSRLVSDDTKLLRWIAETEGIRVDPRFEATYRPRTSVKSFLGHAFARGTMFVDSYAGTGALRSAALIALAIAPALAVAALVWLFVVGWSATALVLLLLLVVLAAAPILPAAINRCPPRSIGAYLLYLPLFAGPFWAGLVRGIVVHRRAFGRGHSGSPAEGQRS
ncbi:glycosyltransferase [Microbacterium sp. X-17]|uniref:glycosyltransferase family 2 protein n=1 Tax=Microbacterium sp. X-17 TaxID=3144404 RepID=UPI0031F5586A